MIHVKTVADPEIYSPNGIAYTATYLNRLSSTPNTNVR